VLAPVNPPDVQFTTYKALKRARMGPKHQLPSPVELNHVGPAVALLPSHPEPKQRAKGDARLAALSQRWFPP